MINKYLIILCFIWCFILTGCVTKQPMATPTVKHLSTSQIKDYLGTGEYDVKHYWCDPFTIDSEGNFYVTDSSIDYRMNIKKYNSQGKYITTWVPEIKRRKKNSWFSEKKYRPISEELTDILADKEYIYIAYGAAYGSDFSEGNFPIDYTGHIEQFDLNGKFITAIKPEKDSFHRDFVRFIAKDKNGNFYLASWRHIEKYDSNWKLQSILYPFEQKHKWYEKRSNFSDGAMILDIIVDSEGYIYILTVFGQYHKLVIAKLDSTGKFIKEFPNDTYKLHSYGVEIDFDDSIYVLGIKVFGIGGKKGIYYIQKFDSSGVFITGWDSEGNAYQYDTTYTDMKIDSKGNVYVDAVNGTIKKFSPKQ